MDRKTAAEFIHHPEASSERGPRTYRTHPDKLEPFWPEVQELLESEPKLKPYVLLEEMLRRHSESFSPTWKLTLKRRVDLRKKVSAFEVQEISNPNTRGEHFLTSVLHRRMPNENRTFKKPSMRRETFHARTS